MTVWNAERFPLHHFSDFCAVLNACGFSLGGGNAKGIFAIVPYSWENQESVDTPIKWHTGDPETDPWEWRMRVLEERQDIAYAKLFFRTSGYCTKDWYPYFYAVRRQGESFAAAYEGGTLSRMAKRVYEAVAQDASSGGIALPEIKHLAAVRREETAEFNRAVVELQMRMFLTMCGRAQKVNRGGEAYGWNSTVFTTVEDFWGQRGVSLPALDPNQAYEALVAQVRKLNPAATPKKIDSFIRG